MLKATDEATPEGVSYAAAIIDAIRSAWTGKSRAKVIARQVGASHRTTENWLQGRKSPNAVQLVELMAASPVVADAVTALVAKRRAARLLELKVRTSHAIACQETARICGRTDNKSSVLGFSDRRQDDRSWSANMPTVCRRVK